MLKTDGYNFTIELLVLYVKKLFSKFNEFLSCKVMHVISQAFSPIFWVVIVSYVLLHCFSTGRWRY